MAEMVDAGTFATAREAIEHLRGMECWSKKSVAWIDSLLAGKAKDGVWLFSSAILRCDHDETGDLSAYGGFEVVFNHEPAEMEVEFKIYSGDPVYDYAAAFGMANIASSIRFSSSVDHFVMDVKGEDGNPLFAWEQKPGERPWIVQGPKESPNG